MFVSVLTLSLARFSHPTAFVTVCSSFHRSLSSKMESNSGSVLRTSTCAHKNTRPGTVLSHPGGSMSCHGFTGASNGVSGAPGPLSVSVSYSEYRCSLQ